MIRNFATCRLEGYKMSQIKAQNSTILSDTEVLESLYKNQITITPIIDVRQIGSTVDLRLGTDFIVKKMDDLPYYDVLSFHEIGINKYSEVKKYYERVKKYHPENPFVLHPGEFALGQTLEFIKLPSDIGAQLEGRSSWAREGLNVHSTAGLIHPGHKGIIVFELQNLGSHPLPLYPGTRVAQLLFYRLNRVTKNPYSNKKGMYHGMTKTEFGTPWKDWEYSVIRRGNNIRRL